MELSFLIKFQFALWLFWVKKNRALVMMYKCDQSLTLTQKVSWDFLHCPTLPTEWAINYPL